MPLHSDADLRRILTENRSVAVVGAKSDPWEVAHRIPTYMKTVGWRVVGVNPKLAGAEWLGSVAVGSVADLPAPVEVIDVFRRPEFLVALAEEIRALAWRPKVVWFQLGIANDEAAELLEAAGIEVVQDRCIMPEHQRLVGR